jgi:hypothetical protein
MGDYGRAREKKPRNQCMKIEQVLNAKTNADTLTQRRADRTTSTHTRTHAKTHKDAHARPHTGTQEPCLHSRHDESNLP